MRASDSDVDVTTIPSTASVPRHAVAALIPAKGPAEEEAIAAGRQ